MRVSSLALLLIATASPMLGGCQSIFGNSRGVRTEVSIPQQGDMAQYAASQMALGKQALGQEQFGQAIIAFRNARLAPEHSAAACNGLAIAYAGIGRPDLAERFFKRAIAEAPEDRRYHANLARFHESLSNSPMRLAKREDVDTSTPALREPATQILPGTAERSAIKVARPMQQIVRVSAKEVQIGMKTALRRPAPGGQTAAGKPVRRVNPAYPVRIEFGDGASPVRVRRAGQYPIRIELDKRGSSARTERPASQHPVRLSLAPTN